MGESLEGCTKKRSAGREFIFVSSDSGTSWARVPTQGLSDPLVMNWSAIAISADGCKLVGSVTAYSSQSEPPSPGAIFSFQYAPAPRLDIASSDGNLLISWIIPSATFHLQQSPDLTKTNWIAVPGTPVLDYSTLRNHIIVPPTPLKMFYRLVSQ